MGLSARQFSSLPTPTVLPSALTSWGCDVTSVSSVEQRWLLDAVGYTSVLTYLTYLTYLTSTSWFLVEQRAATTPLQRTRFWLVLFSSAHVVPAAFPRAVIGARHELYTRGLFLDQVGFESQKQKISNAFDSNLPSDGMIFTNVLHFGARMPADPASILFYSILFYSVLFCSVLFYAIPGCVLPLQEVALRQSPPTFSVLCCPCPYHSLLPHNVISTTTFWSSNWSYTLCF